LSDSRHHLGFESENQLKAFIKALSGAAIPGKFAYVGEAAATYNTHALTREYGQVTRSVADESSLLLKVWGQGLNSVTTLVDVGPGNGLHSVALLRRLLSTASWLPRDYLAIDYSSRMAGLATQNIEHLVSGIQVNSIVYDIENPLIQASSALPAVSESTYLLLGNTIGNVESIPRAIQGIRDLAGRGARLLIGCALFEEYCSTESYLRPYQMSTYIECVLHPLVMIGVPRRAIVFSVEFDPNTRTIFTLARFKELFLTTILDESVVVKAGSTIRCSMSRRFLPGEIPNLLRRLNIDVLGMAEDLPNRHGTYCVIV
jgi:Histidine-specific methyltransferase, SAM-dependent